MSQVSKFDNFFLTCSETVKRLILRACSIIICGKFKFNFPVHFWNRSSHLYSFFCWSVNCWVEYWNYVTYFGDAQKLKLWDLLVLLFMESYRNYFFSVLFGGYKPCFETKNCSKSCICVFIFPKKQHNWF